MQQQPNYHDMMVTQKDYMLDLLAAAGVTEMEYPVVQALPTWASFARLYGNDTAAPVVVGLDTCRQLSQEQGQLHVGVAGMFNTGTTTLDLYLRENLPLPTHGDQRGGFNQGVPWGKHRLWSLRRDFMPKGAEISNDIVVVPIVIIRDPFTWMQSMCTSPYKAQWAHDTSIHCPNLVATFADVSADTVRNVTAVGQAIPAVLTAQKQRQFATLLDLWIEWYQEYLESPEPRIMVRFEDVLIRPDAVVREIQQCLQLPFKQQGNENDLFVYVVGAMKWDQKYVKTQSSMVSALIKYGNGWDRVRNMTTADLDYAKQKLSTGAGRTLSQLFHYHYEWDEM